MTTLIRDAHAATAFSRADVSSSGTLDVSGCFGPFVDNGDNTGWVDRIDDLLGIRNLKDDWDGEETAAPHPSLVDGAITLCQSLQSSGFPPPDRVHASVNETIFLEWHTPSGYREIEVLSPIEAECRWVPRGADLTQVWRLGRSS